MTDTTGTPTPLLTPTPAKIPLDVGKVISDTFSIYFKTLPVFFALVFLPYFLLDLGMNQYIQPLFLGGNFDIGSMILPIAVAMVLFILAFVLIQAILIHIAISVKVGQGVAFGRAVQAAFRSFFPIVGISLMFMLAVAPLYAGLIWLFFSNPDLLGWLFLIVPLFIVGAFYAAAMLYVFMPAIVFENAGFSALGRSLQLTRGYRGAIIGQMLLLALIVAVISGILAMIVGGIMLGAMVGSFDTIAANGQISFPWWYSLFNAAVNALSMPLSLIPPAIVYARLKQIKEGGETGDLLKVFE